jgi:carboxyl-terminal processing protease
MLGSIFDHDITVGEKIKRDKTETLKASSFGKQSFSGKLIVLVNSSSASAAEIFARVVQLEKRGIVVGDQTAGAVGNAELFPERTANFSYIMEITIARLKMSDGADLEGKGVTPDTLMLPTPADLAEGRDPVLSAAAQLAGVQLSPEEAAKMFPVVWPTY